MVLTGEDDGDMTYMRMMEANQHLTLPPTDTNPPADNNTAFPSGAGKASGFKAVYDWGGKHSTWLIQWLLYLLMLQSFHDIKLLDLVEVIYMYKKKVMHHSDENLYVQICCRNYAYYILRISIKLYMQYLELNNGFFLWTPTSRTFI